jgi:uncharacterized protein
MAYDSRSNPWPQPPRRRLSQAVYWRRRVAVLAGVVLVGYGLWSVGSAMFGGSKAPAAAEEAGGGPPATNLQAAPTPTQPGDTTAAPTSSSTTSTTSPPEEPRQISADNPAKIYIAGDSDAGTFGPFVQTQVEKTGFATVTLDYKVSSGLSRPDFFDWGAQFNEQIPALDPDIVIVTFGGNDAQGLRNLDESWEVNYSPGGGGDDADWRAEYGRRVGATMDYLMAGGRTLIWVGIPNDDNPDVTARMQVQDEVVKAEAAKRPGVVLVDTWTRFLSPNGGWAEYRVDPRTGQGEDVRQDDGFHLNENGAEILGLDIMDVLIPELRKRGAQI